MSKVIGIDLGSTLSEVAVMENGKPTIIINEDGSRTTPSVISFRDGERRVGNAAKRLAIAYPKETVILIKRFMGGTYEEVKNNISHVQYEVKDVNGKPRVVINDKEYTPEELSAMILTKMKTIAEDYLGETVTDAVITVPAYFDNAAKEATKRAGEIAGLNVLRLVAEPTAAILASNIDMTAGGKYMVVDYGGSTLDFSVADINDNVVEILASNGDVYCGGSDIDNILANYLVDQFNAENNVDLRTDPKAMSRVFEAAEKAKVELSQSTNTEINLPYIFAVGTTPLNLNVTLTRAKFEQLIDREITKVINYGKEALKKAGITSSDLNGILLVGGSTRIPKVQDELTKAFGVKLIKNVNPDEAVALGASVEASILGGEKSDILLLDVTSIPYGIETMGEVMTTIIDANTTIPTKKTETFTTATDNQPSVPIMVYQGFRPMAHDNKLIGSFVLDGILPARRGEPKIEVTFDIDANGILSVSATDKGTGKEQHITIKDASGLSEDEIKRMKEDAEKFAEEDKAAKDKADKLNAAETFAFQTEKFLSDTSDKLTDEDKKSIQEKLDALNEALKSKDVDVIEPKREELEDAWHAVSSKLYQQAQPDAGQQTGQPGFNPNDLFSGGQNPFSQK